jgi:Raf kinase inhibitor-like YbhB/YbcL family protein
MRRTIPTTVAAALFACLASCAKGEPKMTIAITSPAFADNRPIPKKYTGDGSDVSPPLTWSNLPPGTRELALVCDDPDAPTPEPWVHWVIYKIPPDATSLPENVAPQPNLETPRGALQGRNSWTSGRTVGYRGPAPPPGKTHHYRFHLYALDAPLDLTPEADSKALTRAMKGHILGEGLTTGTYRR